MKTLNAFKLVVDTDDAITIYYTEDDEIKNSEYVLSNFTSEEQTKINDLIDIVNNRISGEESLIEFLAQITENFHLSKERIRYVFGTEDSDYRFLYIDNMTITEQTEYIEVKTVMDNKINE